METRLKVFIKQALLDITEAVNEAQKGSPISIAPGRVEGAIQLEPQMIEFDLAVVASRDTKNSKKGGASVSVISVIKAGIGGGSEAITDTKHSEQNRIRFSVPVYFQAPKMPIGS